MNIKAAIYTALTVIGFSAVTLCAVWFPFVFVWLFWAALGLGILWVIGFIIYMIYAMFDGTFQ